MMAQPQRIVQREQLEQQLVLNRARFQEIDEQLDQLTEQREAAEQQVIALKAALEGYDLGYAKAEHDRAVAEAQAQEAEKAKAKADKEAKG